MEIVPIITYMLLFTVALLLIVLAISILFPKTNLNSERNGQNLILQNMNSSNSEGKINKSIEFIASENKYLSSRNSQIVYINNGREENRKSFSTQIGHQHTDRNTNTGINRKTRSEGKPRFTIVNDTYGADKYSQSYNSVRSNFNYMRTSNSAS